MSKLSRFHPVAVLFIAGLPCLSPAAEISPGWLQTRDQNPFVLGSGLPLAPSIPSAGNWQLDTTYTVANTEMGQSNQVSSLTFDAETSEFRFSAAYAFNERWSLRGSISYLTIGDGYLDGAIEEYHHIFGFTNGDRGLLGTQAPFIRVELDGETIYLLDRKQSGSGPLLLDLTRSWSFGRGNVAGVSLGSKWPIGSTNSLTDTGSTDFSISAFAVYNGGERLTFGARIGMLVQQDNELLGGTARTSVPFANLLFRARINQNWSLIAQADAHAPLYKDLPKFFKASNQFSLGFSRRLGESAELQGIFSEDIPRLHATDIAFGLNLRVNLGPR